MLIKFTAVTSDINSGDSLKVQRVKFLYEAWCFMKPVDMFGN